MEGMTQPYITKEEFDKIQEMRRHTVRKTIKNRVYLFSGIAVCGECGFHLGGRTNVRNRVPLYNCPGHYIKRSGCQNKTNLSERKIETYIVESINEKMRQLKSAYAQFGEKSKQKDHKSEIAALRGKIVKLKELYLNDLITLEEYKEDKASMIDRINKLIELDGPRKRPNFEKIDSILTFGWQDLYFDLSKEEKREFWCVLIKEIRIYPDRHIEFDINL